MSRAPAEGVEERTRATAARVLRDLRGRELALVALSEREFYWHASLVTLDLRVVAVAGSGECQAWTKAGGLSPLRRLPHGASIRTRFDPQGGALLWGGWAADSPGVVSLAPDGSWRWEVDPALDPRPVSAVLRLPSGALALGGRGGLVVRSVEGQERVLAPEEARYPQSLHLWGEKVLSFYVSARGESEDPMGSLRRYDPETGACELLGEVPGFNSLLAPSPDGSRVAVANSHYGRVTVRDEAGEEVVEIFNPAGLGKRSGPMHAVFWGQRSDRVCVFFEVEGERLARLECWDATRPQHLLWTHELGRGRSARPIGPGPDLLVVGYGAEVRVFAYPESPQ